MDLTLHSVQPYFVYRKYDAVKTMPENNSKSAKMGRPLGRNAYGESTTPVRIPNSKLAVISDYLQRCAFRKDIDAIDREQIVKSEPAGQSVALPLYSVKVAAGFPSPADDHIEKRLNIHEYLVKQEDATFMVTITGLSMRDAGLLPKDIAIVDRSKSAAIGQIVLAVVDGEFTIKQLGMTEDGQPLLLPANPEFKPIVIHEDMSFEIWGVVTGSIRKYL
jgi:DNA polymerase V